MYTVRWASDLFTNVIHPSDQIPCVVVRLRASLFFFLFCSVASTLSRAPFSSSSSCYLSLFLPPPLSLSPPFAVVWYVHPECQVSFSLRPCEKRETRENFRMVYGALPVLLLSHFSLPPYIYAWIPAVPLYISFKNFLRLSLRTMPFLFPLRTDGSRIKRCVENASYGKCG